MPGVITAEFWVMRIVRAAGTKGPVPRNLLRAIARSELYLINGDICEPIEVYDGDQEAAMVRAVKEHERTGCVHKVVLNTEL